MIGVFGHAIFYNPLGNLVAAKNFGLDILFVALGLVALLICRFAPEAGHVDPHLVSQARQRLGLEGGHGAKNSLNGLGFVYF